MKKSLFFLIISVFVLVGVAQAGTYKPLTLILDWYVNPDHAPIFVAKQRGFFKKRGIRLQIISPADPSNGPKMVAAGRADIAMTYQPSFMNQVTHGLPLVRFATLVNHPLDCLVTLKREHIHSLKALKGKRIGYSVTGVSSVMLSTMLKHNGLHLSDIEHINVHFDLAQALLAGKIDGFTGGMRNFEPFQLRQVGEKPRLFFPEKNGFPLYDELIFVTNKKNSRDPRLKAFVCALRQAVFYLRANPEKTWRIFAKNHPALNNPLNKQAWFASLPYFDSHPGFLNKKRYRHFSRFLFAQHVIPTLPPLSDYAVDFSEACGPVGLSSVIPGQEKGHVITGFAFQRQARSR
jgi:putative hydroxymethylpyrimidine transport system substrate-binding protein